MADASIDNRTFTFLKTHFLKSMRLRLAYWCNSAHWTLLYQLTHVSCYHKHPFPLRTMLTFGWVVGLSKITLRRRLKEKFELELWADHWVKVLEANTALLLVVRTARIEMEREEWSFTDSPKMRSAAKSGSLKLTGLKMAHCGIQESTQGFALNPWIEENAPSSVMMLVFCVEIAIFMIW